MELFSDSGTRMEPWNYFLMWSSNQTMELFLTVELRSNHGTQIKPGLQNSTLKQILDNIGFLKIDTFSLSKKTSVFDIGS